MDGIELNIRFASKPNELNYCGPTNAHSNFLSYLYGNKSRDEIKEIINKFEALPIYLNAIAKKNNLDSYDFKVAEAYWIGNELLDNFILDDMKDLIEDLIKRGMPKLGGEELKNKLIAGFVPHHIFHVFFVEIGKISGKIEPLFKFKETCRPSYGRVKQIFKDKLLVTRIPIILNNDIYEFGCEEEKEVGYLKEWIPDLKIGEHVAIHWDNAILKLNLTQVQNIDKYTKNFLDKFNSLNKL